MNTLTLSIAMMLAAATTLTAPAAFAGTENFDAVTPGQLPAVGHAVSPEKARRSGKSNRTCQRRASRMS